MINYETKQKKTPLWWGELRNHIDKPTDEKLEILMKRISEIGYYYEDKGWDEWKKKGGKGDKTYDLGYGDGLIKVLHIIIEFFTPMGDTDWEKENVQ